MAGKTKSKKKNAKPQARAAANGAVGADRRAVSPRAYALGMVLLAVCVLSSLMLVLEHFEMALPGCGPASGCDRAAASVWGSVPGLGWPTSFVGLAYFSGLFAAWLWARRGVPAGLRWLVRLGALASVAFLVIMFAGNYICPYCLAVHLANLVFFVVVERTGKAETSSTPALATLVTCFVVASIVLWPINARHHAAMAEAQEDDFQETLQSMVSAAGAADNETNLSDSPDPHDEPGAETAADSGAETGAEPFTGRYLRGPEVAPIRIVALTDFACPDCRRIETQIQQLLAERDDVSFSLKHFPMSDVCNPYLDSDMHPKACYAARAAEAAGILAGNDAFWMMHDWLFENIEEFTIKSLPELARMIGVDPEEFARTMDSEEVDQRILADIEEGKALGLHYTPMIFINGNELSVPKGLFARNAVIRTVEALAATNPPPATAAHDQPPMAFDKYIADWLSGHEYPMPDDTHDWSLGPEDAAARVFVWGDYREPNTARLDARLREILADRPNVRYSFRHYPIDESCNPSASRTIHPLACRASQAAEAAGRLGGLDAYWRMHEWLFQHMDDFSDEALRDAAVEMDLDPDALFAEMDSPEVAQAIEEDCRAGKHLGLRAIPLLFINGRRVPRWHLEGRPVLATMIEKALEGSTPE
jgi:protein-disulfide isomerase/uncharacterized membrane protein